MAYLGNGIYDLLDVIKASKDPSIAYEGLYQDPRRDDTIYYSGDLKPAYGFMDDAKSLQAFKSSAFPQGIDSFRPRIGKPEQSLYYNYQPDFINAPQDDYASLYSTQPDFINAPQDNYASLYSLPKLDTSRFADVDLESGYLDRAGSSDQDIYAEQEKQKGDGIGGLFRFLLGLAVPGSGLFMGDTSALQGIRNLNQRLRNTDFGQSTSLADYLDMRKYGGAQGRRDASARNMAQARGITKSLASKPSSTSGGYQQGPGGSGAQTTGASKSKSQAGPGFSGSGSAAEMGSF